MKTFDEIISHCRDLRAAFERDEARFFLGLVEIEETGMEVIAQGGCPTFADFLRDHELCKPERYARFVKGLSYVGKEEAARIGTHAVMAAASTHDSANAPMFVAAVTAWSSQHGGLFPTRQTSDRILRQVDPRPEVPRPVKQASEVDRLRAALTETQAKLRAAERRIRELEAAIASAKPVKAKVRAAAKGRAVANA